MTNQPSGVKLPTWMGRNCPTQATCKSYGRCMPIIGHDCRSPAQPTSPALPTDEMIEAGARELCQGSPLETAHDVVNRVYLAMQAKAPATSVGGVERAGMAVVAAFDAMDETHDLTPAIENLRAALAQPTVAVGGLREALELCRSRLQSERDRGDESTGYLLNRIDQALSQSSSPVSSNEDAELLAWAKFTRAKQEGKDDYDALMSAIANTLEASSPIVGSGVLVEEDAALLRRVASQIRTYSNMRDAAALEVVAGKIASRAVLAALSIREDVE